MSSSSPLIRERVLGVAGVVMIVAVVAGLVWFVVAGRTDSPAPIDSPSPGDSPTPSPSPTPSTSPAPGTTEPDGGSAFSTPLTQKGLRPSPWRAP